jgi:hypothetical protein
MSRVAPLPAPDYEILRVWQVGADPPLTHDEARILLPSYAAGELDLDRATGIRAHLASGCEACLRDLFSRPFGHQPLAPEAVPVVPEPKAVAPEPAAMAPARPRASRAAWAAGAVVLLAVGLWAAFEVRDRAARIARQSARLSELESERSRLDARLDAAARELADARLDAERARAVAETAGEAATPPVAEQGPEPAGKTRDVRYAEDGVSIRVVGVRVSDVLEEITRQAGAVIRGRVGADPELAVTFDRVPLPEALHRLLGEQTFVLVYDDQRRPRMIELLGDHAPAPAPQAPEPSPVGTEGVLQVLTRHPDVRVSSGLARVLGASAVPLREVIDRGLGHEDKEVRAEAMRIALDTFEADPDLQAAVLGVLAGLSDAAFGELVHSIAGRRDEEVLSYLATQARGELRKRATTVLQEIEPDTSRADG